MNIKEDIDLRERSKVSLSGFKGLDTLSTAVEVSAIHASDMQNLISRDGINHKRFGWSTQYRLRSNSAFPSIKGIFNFTIYSIPFLIVYSDKKFWLVNRSNGEFANITNTRIIDNGNGTVMVDTSINKATSVSPVDEGELEDNESKMFLNDDKVYFVGCGDFLVFSKWNNGHFELRRVVGNEDVYIPTTTENIDCEEETERKKRITAEEKNLLSPYSKNALFGKESLSYTSAESFEVATYFLDTKNFKDLEVKVKRKDGSIVTLVKTSNPGNYAAGSIIKSTVGSFSEKTITTTTTKNVTATTTTTSTGERVTGMSTRLGSVNVWLKTRGANWGSYIGREFGIETDTLSAGQVVRRNGVYAKVLTNRDSWNGSIIFGFNSPSDYGTFTSGMSVTGSSQSVDYGTGTFDSSSQTTTTYDVEVNIGITSQIDLITMSNDGVLAFINTITENTAKTYYGKVNNVDVYYTLPSRFSCKLVYIKNGNVSVLNEIAAMSIPIQINSVSASTSSCSISTTARFNYPNVNFDLSNFSATISTINFGSYIDYDSFTLSDGANPVKYSGSVSFENGTITLNAVSGEADAYAPLTDKPNIEVILERNIDPSMITKSKSGIKFGTQGVPDRLFVVDPKGNMVRYSKDLDFTYFGEKAWCVCGTTDKKITGMDRLNDTTLLVVKEFSSTEPSIYTIKTDGIEIGKTEADTTDILVKFSPFGFQVGMGAVGGITNFNGDCLMVAKDGVYAVSLGENMTVDSRYIIHRSKQISNLLERYDLANSKCVAFNGKYYIFVGGDQKECFVADNKYKTLFNSDESQVNYEWWKWTNIPVSVWGFVDDELWFGTEDGQLCKFTRNFYDETFVKLHQGLIGFNYDDPSTPEVVEVDNPATDEIEMAEPSNIVAFTTLQTLIQDGQIQDKDEFVFDCDFGVNRTEKAELINGNTRIITGANIGNTIYVNGTAKTVYFDSDGFPYIEGNHIQSGNVSYVENARGKAFIIAIMGNRLVLRQGNQDCTFNNYSNVSLQNFKAHTIHKSTVIAEWWTGALDLGTRAYQKTLTWLCLTGEKSLANHLKYGFKTRFNHNDYELLRANNDLEMKETDIQTISLDSEFGSSYTRRLNIRNVNFVMLYFKSDTETDIAINSVQIEFKRIKRNIGVR